ncbi:hypothetical protein Taro_047269 [Colocasia esculenta]|uniref:N-acetyltransferase domain-containing protein n=1 Tax=Colocasia esculenta TaxID=4460 RepID=A0A843X588_COLES|nr:hypothetical protein [Colocasia esculenta]
MAAAAPPSKKGPAAPEITLRPFQLSDVDYLLAWMGDDRVSHYTAWDTLASREEALDYLKNTILPHPCFRAVCVGGRPVGYVSVRPRTGTKRCRGRGSCSFAREYWGREIAPAAVRAMAAEAFREFPELERVEALVDVENAGAHRVMEKAGFVREGVHRRFYVRKGRLWDMSKDTYIEGQVEGTRAIAGSKKLATKNLEEQSMAKTKPWNRDRRSKHNWQHRRDPWIEKA